MKNRYKAKYMKFAEILSERFRQLGLSETAGAKRMGTVQPYINNIIREKRTPSLDRLVSWADALGLNDDERADFILAGIAAHCPDAVAELLQKHFARKVTRLRDGGETEYAVPLPTLDAQREIAARLAEVEAERDLLRARLAQIQAMAAPAASVVQPVEPASLEAPPKRAHPIRPRVRH